MGSRSHDGPDGFDFRPWRRKQLMATAGFTLLSLGFVVWIVARWGEVCVNTDCWGNGDGSAASVAWAGLGIALIGVCVLVMGALMKAPQQVTLVPEGEVNLSKTRVMLRDGWEAGGRPTLLVAGHEVHVGQGDEVHIGGTAYRVLAIDHERHWVTLRPVEADAAPDPATA